LHRLLAATALLCACEPPPAADPEFSDAAVFAFVEFESEQPADLAFALRKFEETIYTSMDLEAAPSRDRAVVPEALTTPDLADIDHPDRDPEAALAIGVAKLSAFEPDPHTGYILLDDQVPVEPGSPDHYDRTFFQGRDCWADRGCEYLFTDNALTKQNALLTITYDLRKDYRWIDMGLPDPSSVPAGETPVNPGDPRWALAARSWLDEEAYGDAGANAILQSYTIEVWIPRDGAGYVGAGVDSTGGGLLRAMVLWSEAELSVTDDEDLILNTTRGGIDDIFDGQEAWLQAQ
jgi:hypothetical protein